MDSASLSRVLTMVLVSFGVTFTLSPVAMRLAQKRGILDRPAWRKLQQRPVPLLGGAAVYAGFAAPLLLMDGMGKKVAVVLAGGALYMLLGLVDDLKSLNPLAKLAGQAAVAMLVVAGSAYAAGPGSGGFPAALPFAWEPLWLGLMVVLINAWNLIDGLDGLATGISALAALGVLAYGFQWPAGGDATATTVAALMLGSSLGFLPHNLPPARIYLGDSGSFLLGYLFVMVLMDSSRGGFPAPAFLLLAGVPLLDVGWAVFRRLRARQPLFRADRKHIHHLLLDAGLSSKESLALLLFFQGLLSLAALFWGALPF